MTVVQTPRIIFLLTAVVTGVNLLFGYELTAIAQAKDQAAAEFNISHSDWRYGFLSAGLPVGAAVCVALIGWVQDAVGRRLTLAAACLTYIGAAVTAYTANGFPQLAAARVLMGFAVGALSSTVPMFIGELAPARLRGALLSMTQVCICTGVLLGFAACKVVSTWRAALIAGAPLAGFFALAFTFVTPFSPRWLVLRGRTAEARAILLRLRGGDAAATDAEMEAIALSLPGKGAGGDGLIAALAEPAVRWAVIIGVVAGFMQQWTGVSAVNSYANNIFAAAGFDSDEAANLAIVLGAVKLAGVLVALPLMDRLGRRALLLLGCAGMAATLLALGLVLRLTPSPTPRAAGIGATACLIAYEFLFDWSAGPVLWVLLGELYPLRVKGRAMAVGTTVAWVNTIMTTQLYPSLSGALGTPGAFFLFAGCCAASAAWIARYLPETKGRSLEEIQALLMGAGTKSRSKAAVAAGSVNGGDEGGDAVALLLPTSAEDAD